MLFMILRKFSLKYDVKHKFILLLCTVNQFTTVLNTFAFLCPYEKIINKCLKNLGKFKKSI